jgi:hypothetical protein
LKSSWPFDRGALATGAATNRRESSGHDVHGLVRREAADRAHHVAHRPRGDHVALGLERDIPGAARVLAGAVAEERRAQRPEQREGEQRAPPRSAAGASLERQLLGPLQPPPSAT